MAEKKKQATQKTQPKKGKPIEIPVPTRREFDAVIKKIATPSTPKKPG